MSREQWEKWKEKTDKTLDQMKLKWDRQDSPTEKTESNVHPTHTLDQLLDCPDCYPKLKEKVIAKEFKDADFKCVECGLPVKKEESAKTEWKCPGCKHGFAKPKD